MEDKLSLEQLNLRLCHLEDQLTETERLISEHSDTIKANFPGYQDHPVLQKVKAIELVEGWTDNRKNPCKYRGYRYKVGEFWYTATLGSSWCSNFCQVEPEGNTETSCVHSVYSEHWSEDSDTPLDDLLKEYEEVENGEAIVIGIALLFLNGDME
jgi:hypothetical protein